MSVKIIKSDIDLVWEQKKFELQIVEMFREAQDIETIAQFMGCSKQEAIKYINTEVDKVKINKGVEPDEVENSRILIAKLDWPENLYCAVFRVVSYEEIPYDTEETINYVFDTLKEREAFVLLARFKKGETQEEIGVTLNITRSRVQQIERKALRKLRHPSRQKWLRDGVHIQRMIKEGELDKRLELQKLREELIISELDKDKQAALDCLRIDIDKDKLKRMQNWQAGSLMVEDMNFSVRAYNCLKRAGINTLLDISDKSLEQLSRIKHLGRATLEEIGEKCESYGLLWPDWYEKGTLTRYDDLMSEEE